MKIGIIVAMDKELALLLPMIKDDDVRMIDGTEFHVGTIMDCDVVVMKCGIGKVNAALNTWKLIHAFSPDLVISTGVAGGAGNGAKMMDLVVGTQVTYHDVWCGPGTVYGEACGCPQYFSSAPEIVALDCLRESADLKHGLICTGDIFVDDPAIVARIKEKFPEVMAVDMESAAIAQTCYLTDVPFFSIRVLSDSPGDNDNNAAQYESFWEEAPERTFNILKHILSSLS